MTPEDLQGRSYVFQNQHAGEVVILLLRPHIITIIPRFLFGLLLFLVPALFMLIPFDIIFPDFPSQRYLVVLSWLWYLFTFAYVFEQFLSWYFNVYLVTNERVVDIDFRGLLSSDISEAPLDKIEDVTSRVIGFFPLLFRYGDVVIQTAAEVGQFEFERVPDPDHVVREISRLIRKGPQ